MLHVMQMVGGHSNENYTIVRTIERAIRCLSSRQRQQASDEANVVLQFQIAGAAFGPDFSGMRRDECSRCDGMVGIDVAVPTTLRAQSEVAFVWAACLEAVDLAEEFLRGRKLDWPV